MKKGRVLFSILATLIIISIYSKSYSITFINYQPRAIKIFIPGFGALTLPALHQDETSSFDSISDSDYYDDEINGNITYNPSEMIISERGWGSIDFDTASHLIFLINNQTLNLKFTHSLQREERIYLITIYNTYVIVHSLKKASTPFHPSVYEIPLAAFSPETSV